MGGVAGGAADVEGFEGYGVCGNVDNCPAAWSEVTIHHLLSHTGGVPNFTSFPDYLPKMMLRVTTQEMIGRFKDKPLG